MKQLIHIISILLFFICFRVSAQWHVDEPYDAWPASNSVFFTPTMVNSSYITHTNSTQVNYSSVGWSFIDGTFSNRIAQLYQPTKGVFSQISLKSNIWIKTALPVLPANNLNTNTTIAFCTDSDGIGHTSTCYQITGTTYGWPTRYAPYVGTNYVSTVTTNYVVCNGVSNSCISTYVVSEITQNPIDLAKIVTNSDNSPFSVVSVVCSTNPGAYSSSLPANSSQQYSSAINYLPYMTNVPQLIATYVVQTINSNTSGYGSEKTSNTNHPSIWFPNTNANLNTYGVWDYDIGLAFNEREDMMTQTTNIIFSSWELQTSTHYPPVSLASIKSNAFGVLLANASGGFLVPSLCDSNEDYSTWCKNPINYWVWYDGVVGGDSGITGWLFEDGTIITNTWGQWHAAVAYPNLPFFMSVNCQVTGLDANNKPTYTVIPSSDLYNYDPHKIVGNDYYATYADSRSAIELLLGLPVGYICVTCNNLTDSNAPGWVVGNINTQSVVHTGSFTNYIPYGDYLGYTPDLHFADFGNGGTNTLGLGHIVTNKYNFTWSNVMYPWKPLQQFHFSFNTNSLTWTEWYTIVDRYNSPLLISVGMGSPCSSNPSYPYSMPSGYYDSLNVSNYAAEFSSDSYLGCSQWTVMDLPPYIYFTNSTTVFTNTLAIKGNPLIDVMTTLPQGALTGIRTNIYIQGNTTAFDTIAINSFTNWSVSYTNGYTLIVGSLTNSYTNIVSKTFTNIQDYLLKVYKVDWGNGTRLTPIIGGGGTTNGWTTNTNGLIPLSTNNVLSATVTTVSTNSATIISTNWNVAAGFHEADYGYDGVWTLVNNAVYYAYNLSDGGFYNSSYDSTIASRYSTNGYVNVSTVASSAEWNGYSGVTDPTNITSVSAIPVIPTNSPLTGVGEHGEGQFSNLIGYQYYNYWTLDIYEIEQLTDCLTHSVTVNTNWYETTSPFWKDVTPLDYGTYTYTTNEYSGVGPPCFGAPNVRNYKAVGTWTHDDADSGWYYVELLNGAASQTPFTYPTTTSTFFPETGYVSHGQPGLFNSVWEGASSARDLYLKGGQGYTINWPGSHLPGRGAEQYSLHPKSGVGYPVPLSQHSPGNVMLPLWSNDIVMTYWDLDSGTTRTNVDWTGTLQFIAGTFSASGDDWRNQAISMYPLYLSWPQYLVVVIDPSEPPSTNLNARWWFGNNWDFYESNTVKQAVQWWNGFNWGTNSWQDYRWGNPSLSNIWDSGHQQGVYAKVSGQVGSSALFKDTTFVGMPKSSYLKDLVYPNDFMDDSSKPFDWTIANAVAVFRFGGAVVGTNGFRYQKTHSTTSP